MKSFMVFLSVLLCSAAACARDGFIEALGTDLVLNGNPYRQISVNKYDLLLQSILCPDEQWEKTNKAAVGKDLQDLHEHGFRIIRFMGGPYSPQDFENYFFDKDADLQAAKRAIYFKRYDRILDLCEKYEIRVIPSLIWWNAVFADLGYHSMHEGVVNPNSLARQRIHDYISAVVGRYKDRTIVAMWELGNEWNLQADRQFKSGLPKNDLVPGNRILVRDETNNFNSEEMADMTRQLAVLIKSIDGNHLITSGHSSPLAAAMHRLRAAKAGFPIDKTRDSKDEMIEYLRMIHPDPIDVISIHYYEEAMECFRAEGGIGNPDNLGQFMEASRQIGKPMIIGEIGLYKKMDDATEDYRKPESLPYLQSCLQEVVKHKFPLTLYWTYHDSIVERNEENWSLEFGKTDAVLQLIEKANQDIKK